MEPIIVKPETKKSDDQHAVKEVWWKRWGRRLLMALGAFTLLSLLMGGLTQCVMSKGSLPQEFVLAVDFKGALNEGADRHSFFSNPEDDFYSVIKAIKEGAQDPEAKALVATIWDGDYSLSQIYELHFALDMWRAAGKPTYAFSHSLGNGVTGMASYWLASGFDQIWVQPLGYVTMGGFRVEIPYARGLLDKLGITPEFFAYKDFKTVMDSATERRIDPAEQEQLTALLNDLNFEFMSDIESSRGLENARIKDIIKASPVFAGTAKELKLIDEAGYFGEINGRVLSDLKNKDMPFVRLGDYIGHVKDKLPKKAVKVAFINIDGVIDDSMIMPEDIQSGGVLFASTNTCITCAIMSTWEDDDIKAIFVRLNSPGGTPGASEAIRNTLLLSRAKGKKVIVSMGDVAASGGYWIASAADKIVAYPTTITGSIGIVGGKISAAGLSDKLDVNWAEVTSDEVGLNFGSSALPMSPEAEKAMRQQLQTLYDAFIEIVSTGRGMSKADVEKVAQGRVWSGKRALDIGLVDALGGLDIAKSELASMLELESGEQIALLEMSAPLSPLAGLKSLLELPGLISQIKAQWDNIQALLQELEIKAQSKNIRLTY